MREALQQVVAGRDLSAADAEDAMAEIMAGDATAAQIAGLLVALRLKGETVDEIVGFAMAMRAASNRLDLGREDLVDTCGTGGDGADTFNISTASALVAAGAGAPIAKHGNRAVSSACGSADVLEALGVGLVSEAEDLRQCFAAAGLVFLFAPAQHPAMKHAVGPRRELGLRTVFNLLGPLTNPAGARRQLVGVYSADLVSPVAEVLGRLGAEHAVVVHGAGGMDEVSTLGPTTAAEWRDGNLREFTIDPERLGCKAPVPAELVGGAASDNAAMIRGLLEGELGPRRDIVLLNSGTALYVAGLADDIAAGMALATESIDSDAAAEVLRRLVTATGGGAS